jgi:hypothetical protein
MYIGIPINKKTIGIAIFMILLILFFLWHRWHFREIEPPKPQSWETKARLECFKGKIK